MLVGAVQTDVTRGNTLSCGCLGREARNTPRGRNDRTLTQAARYWANAQGIPVRANGALHARVLASYQLHVAGLDSILGADMLIPEAEVRTWAAPQQISFLARGRIPSQTWKDYAASHLNTTAAE